MLIGESSQALAVETVRVCRDDELWHDLSRAGQALIEAQCSMRVLSERLGSLLEDAEVGPAESATPVI